MECYELQKMAKGIKKTGVKMVSRTAIKHAYVYSMQSVQKCKQYTKCKKGCMRLIQICRDEKLNDIGDQ